MAAKKSPSTAKLSSTDQLKALLASPSLPTFVYLSAEDNIRKERFIEKLLAKQLGDAWSKSPAFIQLNCLTCLESDVNNFLSEAATLSLFASNKTFLLRHVQNLSANNQKKIAQSIESATDNFNFILLAKNAAAQSALAKLAKEKKALIQLEEINEDNLASWATRELARAGITKYPPQLPALIAQSAQSSDSGNSADETSKMIEQLLCYVDSDSASLGDFLALFQHKIDPHEFALIDALVSGNLSRAYLLSQQVLSSNKRSKESVFPLLSLIFKTYASALGIKDLAKKRLSDKEIADQLGQSPWVINKRAPLARRKSELQLVQNLKEIARIDSLLKNRSIGAESLITELVLQIGK